MLQSFGAILDQASLDLVANQFKMFPLPPSPNFKGGGTLKEGKSDQTDFHFAADPVPNKTGKINTCQQ